MVDLNLPTGQGERSGWILMMFFQQGEEFHHRQLLHGGFAQFNQTEERGHGLIDAAKVMEEFGFDEEGFVGRFVLLEKFVQFVKSFKVLIFVNQTPDGAESNFFLGGGPMVRVQEVGETDPSVVRDDRRQQYSQKAHHGQPANEWTQLAHGVQISRVFSNLVRLREPWGVMAATSSSRTPPISG